MRPPRLALIVGGAVMVPVYGLATLFFLYASAGDCFPELGGPCSTDHDRNMAALRVLMIGALGFTALVFGGWKLNRWLAARERGQ